MYLLCFANFERMPDNRLDSLGVPTCNASMCFTHFEGMLGIKVDCLAVPTFNVPSVFYTVFEDVGKLS